MVIVGGGIIGVSAALFLAEKACRWPCARRATSPASSRAAIGAGSARWGVTHASSRSSSRACVSGRAWASWPRARPASARPASSTPARRMRSWSGVPPGSSTPGPTSSTRACSPGPSSRSCCPVPPACPRAASTREATVAPSRRRRRPPSPGQHAGPGQRSSPTVPCAGSRPRPAVCRPRSRRRAASPATASCSPAGPGRACSAAISASACRSSRCAAPCCAPSRSRGHRRRRRSWASSRSASGWMAATRSPTGSTR